MTITPLASVLLYFGVFITSAVFAFLSNKTKGKKLFIVLAVILPVILLALRGTSVGTDTQAYVDLTQQVSTEDKKMTLTRLSTLSMEPFILISAKILDILGFDYVFLFAVFAAITYGSLFTSSKLLFKEKGWIIYSALALIMLPYCINGMRQASAIGIFTLLLSLILTKKGNLIQKIILFLFMISIHYSSLLLLPVFAAYFLSTKLNFRKVFYFVGIIVLVSLIAFLPTLKIAMASGILPEKYYTTILVYEGINLMNFDFFIFAGLLFLLLVSRKHSFKYDSLFLKHVALVILCGIFYAGIGFFSAYIGRMADYFWPFVLVGAWLFLNTFKDSSRAISCVYLCSFCLYFIAVYLVLGNSEIFPYGFSL